jgi:hexokinase
MPRFNPDSLSDFARSYGFHYDRIDHRGLVEDVLIDMERGLRGQSSSLPMIPSYIPPISHVPAGKTVIALDAGGTNLRAALVRFDEHGKALIGDSRKIPMPGSQGHLSGDQFFDAIAAITAPLMEQAPDVAGIGFTFSYPMEITKEADGILLAFSKEIDAPEVIGKSIGQGLRDALTRRKLEVPGRIVLLNDTVATLLSGLTQIPPGLGPDCYGVEAGPVIGFILGTGFNTAYPELSIPKLGPDQGPQIVVCETGAFAHRYMGVLDREFDAATKNPGTYALEKATAGAYLGPLSLRILKQAVRDGVLSFRKSAEFLAWPTLETKDLSAFMYAPLAREGPIGELFGADELDALSGFVYLASIITERAALLSAAVLAAVVERVGNFFPFSPVRIAVEGTTYVAYKGMRKSLESYLHTMLVSGKPCSYVIAPVDQASLLGAATTASTGE